MLELLIRSATSGESTVDCRECAAFLELLQRTTGEVLLVPCVDQLGNPFSGIGIGIGRLLERWYGLPALGWSWRTGGGSCRIHRLSPSNRALAQLVEASAARSARSTGLAQMTQHHDKVPLVLPRCEIGSRIRCRERRGDQITLHLIALEQA
jgi:hypothetical protein